MRHVVSPRAQQTKNMARRHGHFCRNSAIAPTRPGRAVLMCRNYAIAQFRPCGPPAGST
ncbi:hypothetical protein NOCARDAX2BIS_10009 [Nocardioides sp. AX2bis]|nr:hypothetical protein NOCARDAX2BIS_10009 [Nocardioides sp. AX2bis]